MNVFLVRPQTKQSFMVNITQIQINVTSSIWPDICNISEDSRRRVSFFTKLYPDLGIHTVCCMMQQSSSICTSRAVQHAVLQCMARNHYEHTVNCFNINNSTMADEDAAVAAAEYFLDGHM